MFLAKHKGKNCYLCFYECFVFILFVNIFVLRKEYKRQNNFFLDKYYLAYPILPNSTGIGITAIIC